MRFSSKEILSGCQPYTDNKKRYKVIFAVFISKLPAMQIYSQIVAINIFSKTAAILTPCNIVCR